MIEFLTNIIEYLANTVFGGLIVMLLGCITFTLTFVGKRDMSTGNIKLFMSGLGLMLLGAVIIYQAAKPD